MLHSGEQTQQWPTSGRVGYMTPAAWGGANTSRPGTKSEVAHKWADWLRNPYRLGGSPMLQSGGHNQKWPTSGWVGYINPAVLGVPYASKRGTNQQWPKWAYWLHKPYRLRGPQRFEAGDKIRKGRLATCM